jgi:hypothetical protein
LPVSRHGDELDMLAGIVNAMLDEIERLLGEVKGVCDNIAHDLRTPLTRCARGCIGCSSSSARIARERIARSVHGRHRCTA